MMLGMFAAASCREDITVEQRAPEISVEFQLNLALQGIGGNRTKSADELDGQTLENKITGLTVFVIDLNSSGNLIWSSVQSAFYPVNTSAATQSTELIKIRTSIGKKHIYVGANMSPAQIQSFKNNDGVFTSTGTTYAQTIADFVNLSGRGIVMFGQMTTADNNPIITITGTENQTPIPTKLGLSRVVSKVALTYEASAPGYATIASGIGGSIDADSIWFMLNNTAKSIDFVRGMDSDFSRFLMVDYLKHNIDNPPYYYTDNPSGDFMFYTPVAIVHSEHDTHNVGKIGMPFELTDNPYHRSLDEYLGLDGDGKHRHYTSALYCLESTINTTDFTPAENILGVRRGINTEIVVAAKYTPGSIWHSADASTSPGDAPVSVANETDMISKTANDLNGAGTFYAVRSGDSNMYDFYTYNAKTYLENNPPSGGLPQFITYKRGLGYYTTFISQPAGADIDDDENYNLYRNNYYILNVKEFTPPGAVYPQDKYMLVNSETTEWVQGKPTTVTVE